MRRVLTDEEKESRRLKIIEMYKAGYAQCVIQKEVHICSYGLQKILEEAGLRTPKVGTCGNTGKGADQLREEQKITPKAIGLVRKKIKVGDRIRIISEKSNTGWKENDRDKDKIAKWAVVVNKDHKKFCTVRLEKSGVTDTVNWSDICVAMREGASFVG